MKSYKMKFASRAVLSLGLTFSAIAAPTICLAAGPGGLAFGLKSTVDRMMQADHGVSAFAGVSDPVVLRAVDNINTRGFALRRDGAY